MAHSTVLSAVLLAMAFVTGCDTSSETSATDAALVADGAVTGSVVAVDMAALAYDGPGLIALDTEDGRVTVLIQSSYNLCKADLGPAFDLKPGDRVEVRGDAVEDYPGGPAVRPCASADHYIRRR